MLQIRRGRRTLTRRPSPCAFLSHIMTPAEQTGTPHFRLIRPCALMACLEKQGRPSLFYTQRLLICSCQSCPLYNIC